MMPKTDSVWLPLGLMLVIFVESSIPMDGGPDNVMFLTNLDPTLQNLLHIPLYGTLSFLWMRTLTGRAVAVKHAIWASLVLTLGYGCLDELHQSFVPGRYGGLLDVYLDCIGSVLGILLFARLTGKRIKNNPVKK